MKILSKLLKLAAFALIAVASTGCTTPQKVAYFQNAEEARIIDIIKQQPITVRPEDRLSIVVKTKDPVISDLFNLPIYTNRLGSQMSTNGTGTTLRTYTGPSSEGVAIYTVTPQGNIDFPVLGELHVAGMTRAELAGYIKGEIVGRNLAKDPTVIVEFLSVGVNVMGEVKNPGRYDLNSDNITVLEALTLAGDLKITGLRENVKVLREIDGKLHTYQIDLTNAEQMAASPGYYLQQNDVIYVEPNKMEKRNTTVNGNNALSVSFWISLASLLTSVVTTLGVFINK